MSPLEESNRLTTPGITPRPLTATANATINYCSFTVWQASSRRRGEYLRLTGAVLLAGVEEQLQAEADAEEGAVPADVLAERVGHAGTGEDVHGGAEGADAREYEAVSGKDVLRAPHVADAKAEVTDGVAHAAHVARAVVQQRHRCGDRPTDRRCKSNATVKPWMKRFEFRKGRGWFVRLLTVCFARRAHGDGGGAAPLIPPLRATGGTGDGMDGGAGGHRSLRRRRHSPFGSGGLSPVSARSTLGSHTGKGKLQST